VRRYLLLRREQLKLNSVRPILGAIKFFYRVTVPREWSTLRAMRLPKHRTVPLVLPPEKCWRLIQETRTLHLQTFFRTAYTCGLRQGDTRHLTPEDVLTDRMLLRVRTTKGLNERTVPLPIETLRSLRRYWATHRNPNWLFPSRASLDKIASATAPISQRSTQRGLQQVVASLGWKIPGLCVHTLRHSYATAMLEEGVNLKVLQAYLGHKNLQATEVYLHLTRRGDEQARRIVESIMNGPPADAPSQQEGRRERG